MSQELPGLPIELDAVLANTNVLNALPIPIGFNDGENTVFINKAFTKAFGYELEDIPKVDDFWAKAFPDPVYRQEILAAWTKRIEECQATHGVFKPLEAKICRKDGKFAQILGEGFLFERTPGRMVVLYDISDQKLSLDEIQFKNQLLNILLELPLASESLVPQGRADDTNEDRRYLTCGG